MKVIRILGLFALFLTAISPQREVHAQDSTWTQLPVPIVAGGEVYSIAISPSDPSIVYALAAEDLAADPSGTAARLFSSHDAGISWKEVSNFPKTVGTLSVDPLHSDILYAEESTGLMRSLNGGVDWELIHASSFLFSIASSNLIYSIENRSQSGSSCQPPDLDYIFSRSEDGGLTWSSTQLRCGSGIIQLAVFPAEPDIIYVVFDDVLQKSYNGGETWLSYPIPLCGINNSLLIDPDQPLNLYATGCGDFLMSTNGGEIWQNKGFYFLEYSRMAISDGVLYALPATSYSTPVYRSDDRGKTWWQSINQLPVGGGCLVADPQSPGRVMAGTLGHGVMLTEDGGSSWVESNQGIQTTADLDQVDVAPNDPDVIYVASDSPYQAIYRSIDRGKTWGIPSLGNDSPTHYNPAGGFKPAASPTGQIFDNTVFFQISQIVVNPLHPEIAWSWDDFGIYETQDGVHWQRALSSNSVEDIVVSPAAPDTPFALLYNSDFLDPPLILRRVCQSSYCYWQDQGNNGNMQAIATDPFSGNHLFGVSVAYDMQGKLIGNDISSSLDGGKTWTRIGHLQSEDGAARLIIPPTNPDIFLVLTLNQCCFSPNALISTYKLYFSKDAGVSWKTWTPVSGFLVTWPGPLIVSGGLATFFFGDYSGIHSRAINDPAWQARGLQRPVTGLSGYSNEEQFLVVATDFSLWLQDLPPIHKTWLPIAFN